MSTQASAGSRAIVVSEPGSLSSDSDYFSEFLGVAPVALRLLPHAVGSPLGFVSTAPAFLSAFPGEESFDSVVVLPQL